MPMSTLYLILISALTVIATGLATVIFFLLRKKPQDKNESLLMLQQQINYLSQAMDNRMAESTKAIQTQSNQSSKILSEVSERLAQLDSTNKQVVNHTEKILELESIFKNLLHIFIPSAGSIRPISFSNSSLHRSEQK